MAFVIAFGYFVFWLSAGVEVAGISNGAFMAHRMALEASAQVCRFAEPLLVSADSRRLSSA